MAYFVVSFLVVITLPLVPIGLEFWFSGAITGKSLTMTAAMYSISIGMSSVSVKVAPRQIAFLVTTVIMSFCFAAAFGYISGSSSEPPYCHEAALITIFSVLLWHGAERFHFHVFLQRPFP